MKTQITSRIHIYGLVQGIGYRPFVKQAAEQFKIRGDVRNSGGIVMINAVGTAESVDEFVFYLSKHWPEGGRIDEIHRRDTELYKEYVPGKFDIVTSTSRKEKTPPLIPVDIATCSECEQELLDKKNRRYGHPFISCVACGPRYSIIRGLPYDRDNITMNIFPMCSTCEAEYDQEGKAGSRRRIYAQTIACRDCGPRLKITLQEKSSGKVWNDDEIVDKACEILIHGGIVALKDIGGFHLACRGDLAVATGNMRKVKGREKKPFAIMFRDIPAVKEFCEISEEEEELLLSPARPIVLVRHQGNKPGMEDSASADFGIMLPCNPLQILILERLKGIPLIMTSANKSGEPIIVDDNQMLQWQQKEKLIDAVICHDREIVTPLDDSIVRYVCGKVQMLRRARGYVPEPVYLKRRAETEVFAAGGDLKSSFCLLKGNQAYLSQHFGDLENEAIISAYRKAYERMTDLFQINPVSLVFDKHPAYHSTEIGKQLIKTYKRQTAVQHHFAHAASVLAEHGLEGRVLSVVFDGTGYGEDRRVWGGEFILSDNGEEQKDSGGFVNMERVGSICPVSLIGGDGGARNGKTGMYCYMNAVGISEKQAEEYFRAMSQQENENGATDSDSSKRKMEYKTVSAALRMGIQTVISTSAGRLFDAVSALLGICDYNDYEGECAVLLEKAAAEYMEYSGRDRELLGHPNCITKERIICNPMESSMDNNEDFLIGNTMEIFRLIFEEICNSPKGLKRDDSRRLAYKFHMLLCDMIIHMTEELCEKYKVNHVALSGGTFSNRILLERITVDLEAKGYQVYFNEKVPCGDGGIALGQVYMAKNIET